MRFDYDKISDVLYAYLEEPEGSYYEEVSSGVYLRRDLNTERIIGFMVINYSRRKSAGIFKPIHLRDRRSGREDQSLRGND